MGGIISNFLGSLSPLTPPGRPEGPAAPAMPGALAQMANAESTLGLPGDTGFDPAPSAATLDLSELGSLKPSTGPGASFSLSDLGDLGLADEARTPATARAGAEAVWSDNKEWPSEYRRIEKDFRDVNAPVTAEQAQAANAQIAANRDLETAARADLTPDQQKAYDRVAALTAGDPPARLALQVLLMEGTLTKGKPSKDGKDLLGELDRLAQQPVHAAIDRKALVSDLVQELAAPSSISQQNRATCIYTSLQIQLASQQPAEYARLVGGLASPKGQVKLANGDTMSRYRNAEKADDTNRSISTRLWTTGLMGYAAAPSVRNRKDVVIDADAGVVSYYKVLEGLGGKAQPFEGLNPMNLRDKIDQVVDQFKQLTDQGKPVRVSLDWGEGGQEHALHEVMLTGISGDRAFYNNPWGTQESMALGEFKERLVGVPHQVEFGQPPR